MHDRWILYNGRFLNLSRVTHWDISESPDAMTILYACFGNDDTRIELATMPEPEIAETVIQEILTGEYDVETPPARVTVTNALTITKT